MVEKIVGHAGGSDDSVAGDIVNACVSHLMTNDAVGELTIEAFAGIQSAVWDPSRISVVLDHYIPATTENAARVHHLLREFARGHGMHLFDHAGVCHQVMLENFVLPGDVIIGTDSHTCTYGGLGAFATGVGSTDGAAAMATGRIWLKIPETIRVELKGRLPAHVHAKDLILHLIGRLGADGATYNAFEFCGEGAGAISSAGRFTICNMAIEAGAKTAIFEPDAVTLDFLAHREEKGVFFNSDADAHFLETITIDMTRLVPQVACPFAVDRVKPVDQVQGVKIDQAFIGSCTNGRLEDLRVAARVLEGKKVSSQVRLLIAPASTTIYRQAMAEGLVEIFLAAGAVICNPGCSACFGGQGMLWENEVCIGTHNRNFVGRMGHKRAKVYLASPETTAVSAVAGNIIDPRL
jgi:3-isopropylmalate/(R)-2-methylmalate dehydratase large subunit